jgi:hypothetical protein
MTLQVSKEGFPPEGIILMTYGGMVVKNKNMGVKIYSNSM